MESISVSTITVMIVEISTNYFKIWFFITFIAMIIEIVAGVLFSSLALISDAIHMLTHAFVPGLSLVVIIIATTKQSIQKTFGYHRVEVFAAFINGFSTSLSVIWIAYKAIMRFINPINIDIKMMLIVATFGFVANIATRVILHQGDCEKINLKSAFMYMLADTASSVAIIIGGVVIYFTNWYIIDTALALIVGSVIAKWAFGLLRDSINILLESSSLNVKEVSDCIKSFKVL